MFILIILLCLFYILRFPSVTVNAAANGLILWFEQVLPSLLPFAILSNIIIASDILPTLMGRLLPLIKKVMPVSEYGAFTLLSGFLFGFPMGSKNCAGLLREGKMEKQEAEVLFIITNNMSPVFIQSYILVQQLNLPQYFGWSICILYLPPLLLGKYLLHKNRNSENIHKKSASRLKINFQIVDAGIMNGFETLTKIGGYIMIFSILASCFLLLPVPAILKTVGIGVIELTNGIHYLSSTALSLESKYVLAMVFTAFGGLSGIAQTSAMIKDTGLSMKKYIGTKLILCIITGILAHLLMQCVPINSACQM